MRVTVITPPEPIVTFGEIERHLAYVPDEDRTYVEGLVAAATAWVDGPAGWLGRALGEQTLEAVGRIDCDPVRLPFGPVRGVDSITYTDAAGNEQTVDPANYRQDGDYLAAASGFAWPAAPVRIRYSAGYPLVGDKSTAPDPIKVAIMMLVAQWYNTRAAVNIGKSVSEMPFAVDALLQPYRVYR
jgi:uncharacterized phiE125 gp8 family phage protein